MQAATIALLLVVALVFAPPRLLLPLPLDIGEVSEVVEDVVLSVSITWRTVVAKQRKGDQMSLWSGILLSPVLGCPEIVLIIERPPLEDLKIA